MFSQKTNLKGGKQQDLLPRRRTIQFNYYYYKRVNKTDHCKGKGFQLDSVTSFPKDVIRPPDSGFMFNGLPFLGLLFLPVSFPHFTVILCVSLFSLSVNCSLSSAFRKCHAFLIVRITVGFGEKFHKHKRVKIFQIT